MPALTTIIAAVGAAAAVAGAGVAVYGQHEAAEAEQRNEQLRQKQLNLDANRKQREIIRQQQVARATAVNSATNQGAGTSTGISGVESSIGGQTQTNLSGVRQNQQIGNAIIGNNEDITSAQSISSTGQGLGSLGSGLVRNSETIGRVGTYVGSLFGGSP